MLNSLPPSPKLSFSHLHLSECCIIYLAAQLKYLVVSFDSSFSSFPMVNVLASPIGSTFKIYPKFNTTFSVSTVQRASPFTWIMAITYNCSPAFYFLALLSVLHRAARVMGSVLIQVTLLAYKPLVTSQWTC